MTTHVLILCTHNSARSVLAEAMLNHWARQRGLDWRGHSAGSQPSGRVNPHALDVLRQSGIDVTGLRSKGWDEFTTPGAPPLSIVITVCDSAAVEACPHFPGDAVRVHWGYPDPSNADAADRPRAFELTRQALGYRMLQLLALRPDELTPDTLAAIGRS